MTIDPTTELVEALRRRREALPPAGERLHRQEVGRGFNARDRSARLTEEEENVRLRGWMRLHGGCNFAPQPPPPRWTR